MKKYKYSYGSTRYTPKKVYRTSYNGVKRNLYALGKKPGRHTRITDTDISIAERSFAIAIIGGKLIEFILSITTMIFLIIFTMIKRIIMKIITEGKKVKHEEWVACIKAIIFLLCIYAASACVNIIFPPM
jgi:hypothetical protein